MNDSAQQPSHELDRQPATPGLARHVRVPGLARRVQVMGLSRCLRVPGLAGRPQYGWADEGGEAAPATCMGHLPGLNSNEQ